jgi:hypothetical protein
MFKIDNAIKLASWLAFLMNEEGAAEEGNKISVIVTDEMGNLAEVKFVGDGLNRWESGAGVDIPRVKRRILKEGGRIGGNPAPISVRDYLRSALVGRHFGMKAKDLWAISPGEWTEAEIADALERMVGDGEASFNDAAGERFFVRA